MDIDLLALAGNKNNWLRFKPFIKEHVLSKEAQLVFNTLESFFKKYPAVEDVDWDNFASHFFLFNNAKVRAVAAPNYIAIFDKLKSHTLSITADAVLGHFVTQDYAAQIAAAALAVRTGSGTMDSIAELVSKCDKELGRAINASDLMVQVGVPGTVLRLPSAPGLEWRLEELNISCGPLRQGDFIIVSAYVETGKTTFAASEVTHMATQITSGRPVVWVNNEEQCDKVALRLMQAALGLSLEDIAKDEAAAYAAYAKLLGPTTIHVSKTDSSMNRVDSLTSLFRELNPALIVFDQLDKVSGFHNKDQGEHLRLGRLYKWARELSHEYGPVIAVSQSDASGEGSRYITMAQMRGSKVDKPGEADAIVTIGMSDDKTEQNKRYLHLPKNKLTGGPRSVAADRHGYWEIDIKPEIARFEGTK